MSIAQLTEYEKILGWRMQRLMEAGYSLAGSSALAGKLDVDLHKAIKMLDSGCTEKTALKILL